ncbi:unnamed protein product [Lactuca virosa]|uniref:Uncharacterized protein n=1 Tax=Lactuca virosa TaxID=75947 RepID=A0AAU9MJV1_9ASTR|nr:unnamed protein product [Lactuca virosa]
MLQLAPKLTLFWHNRWSIQQPIFSKIIIAAAVHQHPSHGKMERVKAFALVHIRLSFLLIYDSSGMAGRMR